MLGWRTLAHKRMGIKGCEVTMQNRSTEAIQQLGVVRYEKEAVDYRRSPVSNHL